MKPYYMSDGLKRAMCKLKALTGGEFVFGSEGKCLQPSAAAASYPMMTYLPANQGASSPHKNQPQASYTSLPAKESGDLLTKGHKYSNY